MGLANVKQEIVEQAAAEARALSKETAAQTAVLLKEAQQNIDAYAKKAEADNVALCRQIEQQELSGARFEAKKLLLNQRKVLVDAVFAALSEKVSSLPDSKREAQLKRLLERAGKEIEVETVYVHSSDTALLKGVKVKPINIIGGLIAENKEGTIRVDHSFDQLLEQLKETELAAIAKELF